MVQVAIRLGLVVLVALLVSFEASRALAGNMADGITYATAVDAWLAGGSPYSQQQIAGPYALHEIAGGHGFVYPPTALPLLIPTTWGDLSMRLWALAGMLAFAAVAAIIVDRRLGPTWALAGASVALLMPATAEVGQASAWTAAAVGATWLWRRAGAVAAAAAGCLKLYPFLAVRWWPALVVPAVLALGTAGLWSDWLTAWTNAEPGCPAGSLPSLACATGMAWPGYALGAIFLVGALVAPPAVGFFLLTVAMIVPAPDLYQGYLLTPLIGLLPWASLQIELLVHRHQPEVVDPDGPTEDTNRGGIRGHTNVKDLPRRKRDDRRPDAHVNRHVDIWNGAAGHLRAVAEDVESPE